MNEWQMVATIAGVCITFGTLLWKIFSVASLTTQNTAAIEATKARIGKLEERQSTVEQETTQKLQVISNTLVRIEEWMRHVDEKLNDMSLRISALERGRRVEDESHRG
jgi:heme/copper-type cytochrome/quinol oxidase subunit 1